MGRRAAASYSWPTGLSPVRRSWISAAPLNPVSGRQLAAVVEFDGAADLLTDSTLASSPAASGVRSLLTVRRRRRVQYPRQRQRLRYVQCKHIRHRRGYLSKQRHRVSERHRDGSANRQHFYQQRQRDGVSANVAIQDAGALVGLTIQDNTISDAASNITAVELLNSEFRNLRFAEYTGHRQCHQLDGVRRNGDSCRNRRQQREVFIVGNQVNAGSVRDRSVVATRRWLEPKRRRPRQRLPRQRNRRVNQRPKRQRLFLGWIWAAAAWAVLAATTSAASRHRRPQPPGPLFSVTSRRRRGRSRPR